MKEDSISPGQKQINAANALKRKGYTNSFIAWRLNIPESVVRNFLTRPVRTTYKASA
jgi:hypothetical protein